MDDKQSIGHIIEVNGPVVKIFCDILPPLYQALSTDTDTNTLCFRSVSASR